MILFRNASGLLKNKEVINGLFYYTIELKNGRQKTVYFSEDVCPHANINDEVFFSYNTSFSKNKKGVLLSNNIYHAIAKLNNIPFSLAFKDMLSLITLAFSTNLIFRSLLISYFAFSHISTEAQLVAVLSTFIVWLFYITYFFTTNLIHFLKIKEKKDILYKPYIKEQFSKKERFFNKKLNNLERLHLDNFVNQQEHLSSSEKIEISEIIETEKKLCISDITFLEIKNIKNKMKQQNKIKQLLLK